MLIVDGRSGACQVVDFVDLEEEGMDDVVADELEVGMVEEMSNVVLAPREKIIDTDDVSARSEEVFAEVTAEKTCSASHENPFHHSLLGPASVFLAIGHEQEAFFLEGRFLDLDEFLDPFIGQPQERRQIFPGERRLFS